MRVTRASVRALTIGMALVAAVAACGNAPPDSVTATSSSGGGAIQADGNRAPTAHISETDALRFEPAGIAVRVGDVVQWTNTGAIAHNVTFDEGTHSDTMFRGDKYALSFTTAGTFHYVCTFHSAQGMVGTVTVTG
jgi:plastocyanin